MSTERYFAGDAMTGNKECNAYKSIRGNDYTISKCFSTQKIDDLWLIDFREDGICNGFASSCYDNI